jgi:hypothetical protein
MPDAGDNKHFLLLEQNHFYALSWMIAELGKLKDTGLRVIAIKEALQQVSVTDHVQALKKAYTYTGSLQPQIKNLLLKADQICKIYFKEKQLQKLVIGTAATLK